MLSLSATFEKSNGRKHTWRMKHANPNKTAKEIKTSLEKLTKLDIFEKDGVIFFEKVITAKFIETIETPIFDKKTDTQLESPKTKPVYEQRPIDTIQDPKYLIVQQELIKPGMLELLFELPKGIEPQAISENEAASLIMAMVPKGGTVEDFNVIEETHPVRFRLLVKLEEEPDSLKATAVPTRGKKKRGRLIERLRKRRE